VNPTIYILLPVHNRREITRRFVTCLAEQSYRYFHLVLIDDGCSDGTAQMVRDSIAELTVLRGQGSWWWAGSLQQGYLWLKDRPVPGDDLVLIINDDTEVDPDFLENAVALLRGRQRTMLLARGYCREDGTLQDAGVHADWRSFTFETTTEPERINCFSTRGLFMKVSDFTALGGFHPGLLPHYASDYEFTIRGYRKGMCMLTDPACRLRLDRQATGSTVLDAGSLLGSLSLWFSNRSYRNPLMWSAFIVLSCPRKYQVLNLARVWVGFLRDLLGLARLCLLKDGKGLG
jgi:GT2 family glycosyltransferase